MTVASYILPRFKAIDDFGHPMVEAKLYTYQKKTTTPAATYQDAQQSAANTNPIVLNASGEAIIYLLSNQVYTFVLKDANDVSVWSQDDVTGAASSQDLQNTDSAIRADLANANDASKGANMIGFKQRGTGTVPRTVQSKLEERLTPQDFGAVGDGVADDTLPMKAFAAAESRRKYIPGGSYKITQMLAFKPGDIVEGDGARSIIDASAATSWPDASVISVSGALTQVSNLSANATIGNDTLSLASVSGVAKGNALVIYNPTDFSWSGWRAQYRAGEFVRVNSISGTTVRLMNSLYDSYALGAVNLYRLDGAATVFSDFTVLAPALEIVGVAMRMIDRPVMRNVWCTGALGASLEFERCMDFQFFGSAFQSQPATNDEYGLSIANSHGGVVVGASLNAGRHGLTGGGYDVVGGVSSRDVTVQVAQTGNYAGTASQDLHGNTEDFRFFGGTFQNGSALGGQNHKFVGVRFNGKQNGNGIAVYAAELRGGSFEFTSCAFESITNPNASGFGIVDFGNLSSATRAPCKFVLRGCSFKAPASTAYAVSLVITGTTHQPSIIVEGSDLDASGLTQFLRISRTSGVGTVSRVAIPSVYNLATGASYVENVGPGVTVSRYTLPRQSGVASVPGVTSSNNASASVVFNHAYPVSPTVITFKANGTTLGGVAFIPDVQGVSATAVTVNATTASGENYPNTTAGNIGWEALIDQN